MATSNRNRRIAKEIAGIKNDPHCNIIVEPAGNGDDLTHLHGQFKGPPDTPYEGGTYVIDINIPSEYPFRPPVMRFMTKIWHPNISSQTGAICLDTLSSHWSPVLTIKTALISLQSLLSTPEPTDPQDAEVAGQLKDKPKDFDTKARIWAALHAGAPEKDIGESSGGATEESLQEKKKQDKQKQGQAKMAAYKGYNKQLVDRFVAMGFDVDAVVAAFEYVGIDRMGGEDYELEEAYMGDVTARLFGEA